MSQLGGKEGVMISKILSSKRSDVVACNGPMPSRVY